MKNLQILTEKAFEEAIEHHLLSHSGYIQGNPADFNRELALDIQVLTSFLKESQPESWEKSSKIHGAAVEKKLLQRLCDELESRGCLDVIRNGFIDYGVAYKMAFFKPVSGLNPETERLYKLNRLMITRQVKYSLKNENSIDILLSLNGLPIATVELKNFFTGQSAGDAKKQYADSRDPKDLLFQFKKRALVHFAVDPDEIYMTTRLQGEKTRYLPFNKGCSNGAGNPLNPGGYKTSYLWEMVWKKESWMEIIGRFLHIQTEEFKTDGVTVKKEDLLFPRFHQLDVVRKLITDSKQRGPGHNYLIQHSAGSGKSNSIAWLAYHLSSLHDDDDKRVFDSVIVVTDRLVLDKQLQDTIYQFEHKQGVVQKIDKDSTQLASALNAGTNIVITTLQKFPFVLEKISQLPARDYAVIIDEAHSSQGGESAKKLKEVLIARSYEDAVREDTPDYSAESDAEDEIRRSMETRGPQKNLSFFAFTATPKSRTLEVFGEKVEEGNPVPFHLYSMRQAIEEGFILDVLLSYTTYKTYYNLSKAIEDDPKIDKKKATRAIARFVSLHPHNLAQKTEVIIEHFRQVTMKKIGGKAKAMVVTSSRLHVVRYKQEFDKYLKENGYTDIKALVAFSGKVRDEFDVVFSESEMNGFSEAQLPEEFNTIEFQLLLVADKYQTGYDQPLLHTMYVDKKLSGVRAVQTLSRLNRTHPGKKDTFILDFANEKEEILLAFQPYYELTTTESSDPNRLYDLKNLIDSTQVIWETEIDSFCTVFSKSSSYHTQKDHAQLNAYIDPACDRYKALETEEKKEKFKHTLISFVRLYAFLAQIMPFQDIDLEKFYTYGRYLLSKLPKKELSERFKLGDEVALEYYRLQKISEGSITLINGKPGVVKPPMDAGGGKRDDELAPLSEIIDILNEKFGTDFTDADKLFFSQIEEELVADETLSLQAKSNTIENFKFGFEELFLMRVIDRMEQNQEIFKKIMDNPAFQVEVKKLMLERVYKRLNEDEQR